MVDFIVVAHAFVTLDLKIITSGAFSFAEQYGLALARTKLLKWTYVVRCQKVKNSDLCFIKKTNYAIFA